jgi:IBR domain, a half RING-finger domain/RING-type zinc-finger
MYGGCENSEKEVQEALLAKVEALHKFEHTIILYPGLLQGAKQGGIRRLKERFGEAIRTNLESFYQSSITIVGSYEDFHEAQALLIDSFRNPDVTSLTRTGPDCVVCWTEANNPLQTRCGHVYCKQCLSDQASSAGESDIPLRCLGDAATCRHAFSMTDLNAMLSPASLEDLLQASFNIHIRTRPNEFQYCPTPDCLQVYRPTKTSQIFMCPTCLTPICTTCNVISHDGMSCEEWKDMDSNESRVFRQYKEEHDVRDCPNCKMGIEKIEGCNHMTCTRCGVQICWFCMKNFKLTEDVYTHMINVHGNIGGDEDDEEEEEGDLF